MILLPIADARIRIVSHGSVWVLHPSNDAVLAYCTTEDEARSVIAALRMIAALARTGSVGDLPELVQFDFATIHQEPIEVER